MSREKRHYDSPWFSFYPGFKKLNLVFGPASYFDNRYYLRFSLGWGEFYFHFPFLTSDYDECEPPQYGFYFYSYSSKFPDSLVICRGRKNKYIHLPWSLDWVRTSVLRTNGEWEHETRKDRKDFWDSKWKKLISSDIYPYTYTLKSGKVQERLAEVSVEEREWRPRWFKWTSLLRRVDKSIKVEFIEEVGERSGSWKGGTIGCGYSMREGETPRQTLERMERERRFR